MAKIIENTKGFKVIQCSLIECVHVFGGEGICDSCNKMAARGYYIAVLNRWYCPDCYREWMENATYYPEDAEIENDNFEFYRKLFVI